MRKDSKTTIASDETGVTAAKRSSAGAGRRREATKRTADALERGTASVVRDGGETADVAEGRGARMDTAVADATIETSEDTMQSSTTRNVRVDKADAGEVELVADESDTGGEGNTNAGADARGRDETSVGTDANDSADTSVDANAPGGDETDVDADADAGDSTDGPDDEPDIDAAATDDEAPEGPAFDPYRSGRIATVTPEASAALDGDPRLLSANLALCLVEILAGARSLEHIGRWVTDSVFVQLLRRSVIASRARSAAGEKSMRPRVRIGEPRLCELSDSAMEAVVMVHQPTRSRAVAMRLEQHRSRWRATAITVL